jgi:NCAIR mutase (PurE)-related protein
MTPSELRELLDRIHRGDVDPGEAHARLVDVLSAAPLANLGFARVDHHRVVRQGFPEVVFGQGKTPEQVAHIAEQIVVQGQTLLITRTDEHAFQAVQHLIPGATFHPVARAISFRQGDVEPGRGTILVIAAGTADLPVAEEAGLASELMGNVTERLYDVGVAGIHRLLAEHSRLRSARVLIVVAGMEGALPSVVAGLVRAPVIAVPTSVGYGTSFGGVAALLAMLNSCSVGLSVVNIDNGFGAGAIASKINHL